MKPTPPTPIQQAFQHALEHHQRGQLQQAQTLYRQILQAAPRHADALHLLGVIALQGGDGEAAIGLIQKAIQVRPADNYYCNLGNALKAQGQRSEAIASYRQALALNEDLAEAQCNLGHALLEQGDVDEAVVRCRRAIALKPAFAEAHCNLGNALLKQGHVQDAVACYRQALLVQPGLAVAHSNLGHALVQQGDLDAAIVACQRALELQPNMAAAYSHLGDALQRKGLDTQALACFGHALSVGPESADLHRKRGRLFRQRGELERAIGSGVQALKCSDDADTRAEFVQAVKTAHFHAPQAEVRACVLRALQERWADPGDLLTPATSLVESRPAVQQAILRTLGTSPPAVLDAAVLADIAGDRLLLCLLESDALNSPVLERLLTAVRRQWLDDVASGPSSPDPTLTFHCAIARQCFINEYVYACSENELQQLAQLHASLEACWAGHTTPDPQCLAVSAAYAPLSHLSGAAAWATMPWPAPLAALFTQQVTEPALERRTRDAMPCLTAIDDPVSRRVRQQYEENPYPRWMHAPPAAAPVDIDTWLHGQFRDAPFQPLNKTGPLDVLVAGCGTGQHAIRAAQQFKAARVLAVDLSLSSLSYAQRKSDEIGLRNIDYAQADILRLGAISKRFDLIESAGVLHHLADPLAGWQVLVDLLRPGGLMFLGLYSEQGRRDVVAARCRIAERGFSAAATDIRRCRQELMADDLAPQFEQFLSSRDFYSTSACRDLLFHVQEHRFTLPQLKGLLARLGLNFIGFEVDADIAASYARQFPGDTARTDLDHWHAFETARPATFSRMYPFWVQKPGHAAGPSAGGPGLGQA